MKGNKIYIVRKFILASSAKDAIKKQARCEIDDVYIDHEMTKQLNAIDNEFKENSKIGFEQK